MKTQSPDTRPEAERVQIDLLRRASPARRFALARSLSRTTIQLSRRAIRRAHPEADEAHLQLLYVVFHYNQALADRLAGPLARKVGVMNIPELLDVMAPIVAVFEQLGILYHIGGSVASSVYGIPRATLDIDLVADIRPEQVRPFVKLLETSYDVDEDAVREPLRYQSSFNLLHLDTMIKVDVFIPKASAFDRQVFLRKRQDTLDPTDQARLFYLASAEDMVLKKLLWYKAGGMVSDQQWKDVLGILKVQATALDLPYLNQWAGQLVIGDLLARALVEAGLAPEPPTE